MTKGNVLRSGARVAAGMFLCGAISACGGNQGEAPRTSTPDDLPAIAAWLGLNSEDRGEPLTADQRDQVLSILRLRRIEVSQARYTADDMVLAEGDMVFDARKLLESAQGDVEKGYYWKNTGTVAKYKDIHMTSDPTLPPNAIWTWAVVNGGSDWNAHTHVVFTTVAPGGTSAILKVQAGAFPAGFECFAAFTTAPLNGQPGVIALNTTFHWGPGGCTNPNLPAACRVASLDSFTWNQMVHTTTHEMGHALGFGHPADPTNPGVDLIPGTRSAANPDNPMYASVMWGGTQGCYPGNANVTLGLTSDDIASSNVKYP